MMRHHLHMPSYFLGTFTEYPFCKSYFYYLYQILVRTIHKGTNTLNITLNK